MFYTQQFFSCCCLLSCEDKRAANVPEPRVQPAARVSPWNPMCLNHVTSEHNVWQKQKNSYRATGLKKDVWISVCTFWQFIKPLFFNSGGNEGDKPFYILTSYFICSLFISSPFSLAKPLFYFWPLPEQRPITLPAAELRLAKHRLIDNPEYKRKVFWHKREKTQAAAAASYGDVHSEATSGTFLHTSHLMDRPIKTSTDWELL